MLQSGELTGFTVSELFRGNQQGEERVSLPPLLPKLGLTQRKRVERGILYKRSYIVNN